VTFSGNRFSGGHSSWGVLLGVADICSARFQVGEGRWERHFLKMAVFDQLAADSWRLRGGVCTKLASEMQSIKDFGDSSICKTDCYHPTFGAIQNRPVQHACIEKVSVGNEICRLKTLFPCQLGNLVSAPPPTPLARRETRSYEAVLRENIVHPRVVCFTSFEKVRRTRTIRGRNLQGHSYLRREGLASDQTLRVGLGG